MFGDETKKDLPVFTTEFAKEALKVLIELNNDEELRREAFLHEMDLKERNRQLDEVKEEGKSEAKIEAVKNMLKLNLSKEVISQSTGLSIEEIEEIIKE